MVLVQPRRVSVRVQEAPAEEPPAATDDAPESAEAAEGGEGEGGEDAEDAEEEEPKMEVVVATAPHDPRFPSTNQARHCYTRYNEFYRYRPCASCSLWPRNRQAADVRCVATSSPADALSTQRRLSSKRQGHQSGHSCRPDTCVGLLARAPFVQPRQALRNSAVSPGRCKSQKSEDDPQCLFFKKAYRSLCPGDWVRQPHAAHTANPLRALLLTTLWSASRARSFPLHAGLLTVTRTMSL